MTNKFSTRLASSKLFDPLVHRIITPIDSQNPPEGFREARVVFFIGGGRASGKTTVKDYLFDLLEEQGISPQYVGKMGSYAFADLLDKPSVQRVRARIDAYFEKHTKAGSIDKASKKSKSDGLSVEVLDQVLDTILEQGSPVVVDNHMGNPIIVDKIVAKAKAHGYETVLISPHIRPENYFSRIQRRFETTGRPYNLRDGLKRHVEFASALPHYEDIFDMTLLLDNNAHEKAPTPIAYSIAGDVTVLDKEEYANAKQKTEININARDSSEVWPERADGHWQAGDEKADGNGSAKMGKGNAQNRQSEYVSPQADGVWAQRVLSHYFEGKAGHGR